MLDPVSLRPLTRGEPRRGERAASGTLSVGYNYTPRIVNGYSPNGNSGGGGSSGYTAAAAPPASAGAAAYGGTPAEQEEASPIPTALLEKEAPTPRIGEDYIEVTSPGRN